MRYTMYTSRTKQHGTARDQKASARPDRYSESALATCTAKQGRTNLASLQCHRDGASNELRYIHWTRPGKSKYMFAPLPRLKPKDRPAHRTDLLTVLTPGRLA